MTHAASRWVEIYSNTVKQSEKNSDDSMKSSMLRYLMGQMENKSDAEAASPSLLSVENNIDKGTLIARNR